MRQITINEGQCLLDISTQHLGDASKAFEMAFYNNIGITDEPAIGEILLIEDVAIENKKMVADFENNSVVPASKKENSELLNEGIEYWAIEEDFIVT